MQRKATIQYYQENPEVSVLVIGAGINGIGTFYDLALQGIDVLLVDKNDFCSGASAASSRMAHGGIRYLETGEFRLVQESLTERNRLLQNAPHAVKPFPISVPVYSWWSGILNAPLKFMGFLKKPSERGAIVIKLGMMMYDWLTRNNRMMPPHQFLMHEAALNKHPKLNPDVIGVGMYYDTLMPAAERIGVELILDAEAENDNAHALNYVKLAGGSHDSVTLRDEVTGDTFTVKPKLVINATGAWIDFANRAMNVETRLMGGTKGSHIMVDHPELFKTLDGNAIYFENPDGRMCIFSPVGDKVMIGATDIRIDDPDDALCTDDEIDYFLTFTQHVMPDLTVERSQIVFHFSGVRPLPASDAEFTGLISRDHSIQVIEPDENIAFPIYCLVGGKWTTFRAFAEQTTDKALAFLNRQRQTSTAQLAFGGGKNYPQEPFAETQQAADLAQQSQLPLFRLQSLFERYGTRVAAVVDYLMAGDEQDSAHCFDYTRREFAFLAENEKVVHIDDILIHRSMLALLGYVDLEALRFIGEAIQPVLGWSDEQLADEIQYTREVLSSQHGMAIA
jgi:glycerol-3-phosphate dehydrogenase